jgi:hypothetical protein
MSTVQTPLTFDFNTFYEYYTNENNVRISTTPPTLNYYDKYKASTVL